MPAVVTRNSSIHDGKKPAKSYIVGNVPVKVELEKSPVMERQYGNGLDGDGAENPKAKGRNNTSRENGMGGGVGGQVQ